MAGADSPRAADCCFYQGADLLIAADCTAYAYGRFHQDFIRNRIVLIGCPKLDDTDYSLKLTDILAKNEIRSVTVVRMEVPCCGGISYAAEKAVARCGKNCRCKSSPSARTGRFAADAGEICL